MKAKELKIGDRVRIINIPGYGIPDYYLHKGTRLVYKKIIARQRSVRISRIDECGDPWYTVKFRKKNGTIETHSLNVVATDNNWVKVVRHGT